MDVRRRWIVMIPSHRIGGPMMALTEYGPMDATDGYRLTSYPSRRDAEIAAAELWERDGAIRDFGRPIAVEMDGGRMINPGG